MPICPSCGENTPPNTRFCEACGAELPAAARRLHRSRPMATADSAA
ncbi:MAG: zinc-ribbon domain-containing protein [Actinobacteria bacterium]|nr:MAG: zinc-ribbon domain-containing protein [Actinomycetota bacterium]